ncbi:MAG: ribonuclease III [Gammaproteobacteria bacterium]
MSSPDRLEQRLGYRFTDASLLQQALSHRSVGSSNNERLEFLGDAVLGTVIAGELYRRFPRASEGRLSRLRATLVRRESLADIARILEIGQYLQLGPGERKSGGHRRDSIMSDAVEAVLGAIYLDSDFATCRRCILALFEARLEELTETAVLKDPKTRLQEFLQARRRPLPEYAVIDVSGDAHAQQFRVECRVDGGEPATGAGGSRRQAEQDAAAQILQQLESERSHD